MEVRKLVWFLFCGVMMSGNVLADAYHQGSAEDLQRLATEITRNGASFDNLRELTAIGPRLSGSASAQQAVEWAKKKMESYGFDRVWLQPVTVPHWERGAHEEASLLDGTGGRTPLMMAALGGSAGTSPNGIEAQVIEVHSLAEVAQRGNEVRGKIVFYNRPMDPALDPFAAYDGAFDQRSSGPAVAARYGAVGVLVRSLTLLADDDHPHTGSINAEGRNAKIPSAALSTHAANILSSGLKADPHVRVHMMLSSQNLPDVTSYNVIGEVRGSERPDEIIVAGGHLDSWDLATGAHDDAAGIVQSLEILRAMKSLRMTPKRTIRVVFFMAEELGGYGGSEYARQAGLNHEQHVAALESDRGGFAPEGFAVDAGPNVLRKIQGWKADLQPLHADAITAGEGGTDIDPLGVLGVPLIGFIPDSAHYFDMHHSALDRIDIVKPEELAAGAAAMAGLVYLISEQGLP